MTASVTGERDKKREAEPLFVRLGIQILRAQHAKMPPPVDEDGVHVLNAEERKKIVSVGRWMIFRAAFAGALSTVVAAICEVWAQPLLGPRPKHADLRAQVHFYGIVFGAMAVTSVLEIAYLYWDALRSVHNLSRAAGLDLFPAGKDGRRLASAMARAALELPNPRAEVEGVDPWREASRTRLIFASLVYKAKISATNFLLKFLIRRTLGRAAVRTWLPFVAVPITAFWNGVIAWLIVREATLRAIGPSAAHELVRLAWDGSPELSLTAKDAALRAVAAAIVRKEDVHPNLAALFHVVRSRLRGEDEAPISVGASQLEAERTLKNLDDSKVFFEELATLSKEESALVLRTLAIAVVMDGRLTKREGRLVGEAFEKTGRAVDIAKIAALRSVFVSGKEASRDLVRATVDDV